MKRREHRCHATVIARAGSPPRPILLGLGPGMTYEMTADEAQRLALALADAIDQSRQHPQTRSAPAPEPHHPTTTERTTP